MYELLVRLNIPVCPLTALWWTALDVDVVPGGELHAPVTPSSSCRRSAPEPPGGERWGVAGRLRPDVADARTKKKKRAGISL